ncbi:hypothetical protein [Pseudomonas sp. Irchel s3h14]|uniref:hypothetical protein n=1 Tax=Pseudomonas sp. Irchel s3h14 TaxID=2009179 RepID=UPI000BA365E8|nr:hypothetical protein [Pseudomonas sp. Irchel s3h14]
MLNTSFSALTRDANLGMFDIDPVTKSLHAQSKSGCCWRLLKIGYVMRLLAQHRLGKDLVVAVA